MPRRPLPGLFVFPLSGGGVEKRRLGVKRDDRRTSHGRAEGRSIAQSRWGFCEVGWDSLKSVYWSVVVWCGCGLLGVELRWTRVDLCARDLRC